VATTLAVGSCGGTVVAAPSRLRSGPFGPHLGLGGPGLGVAVPPPEAEDVARVGDGLDGDVHTATRRRELHEPAGSARPGRLGLAIGKGGRALPRVCCSAVPRSRIPIFVPVGLATLVTVRRWW
jgi:hypothetical protein